MDDQRVTAGDALAFVGTTEPEALKLVGDLMEYNAQATSGLLQSLLDGEIHAHEQTRQRLHEANAHVALIERRVTWLLGGPDSLLYGEGP